MSERIPDEYEIDKSWLKPVPNIPADERCIHTSQVQPRTGCSLCLDLEPVRITGEMVKRARKRNTFNPSKYHQ